MKNMHYVINGVLAVAIIVLFILFFSNKNTSAEPASVKFDSDSTVTLPIAYVNIDSVLLNYEYAKQASDELMKRAESSRASMNSKQRQVQNEYAEFQRKIQNNEYLSQQRAESEHNRIQKLAADLKKTAARLDNELALEQMKVNNQLADSVRLCITEYNKTANFHIIFSNSGLDNILYADAKYDITDAIVNLLNKRFAGTKPSETKKEEPNGPLAPTTLTSPITTDKK